MSVEKYPAMAISKGTENLDFYPQTFIRHLSLGVEPFYPLYISADTKHSILASMIENGKIVLHRVRRELGK